MIQPSLPPLPLQPHVEPALLVGATAAFHAGCHLLLLPHRRATMGASTLDARPPSMNCPVVESRRCPPWFFWLLIHHSLSYCIGSWPAKPPGMNRRGAPPFQIAIRPSNPPSCCLCFKPPPPSCRRCGPPPATLAGSAAPFYLFCCPAELRLQRRHELPGSTAGAEPGHPRWLPACLAFLLQAARFTSAEDSLMSAGCWAPTPPPAAPLHAHLKIVACCLKKGRWEADWGVEKKEAAAP